MRITQLLFVTCYSLLYGWQGCALGLGRLGLETSRDVAKSRLGLGTQGLGSRLDFGIQRLGLVSVSTLNVSVSAIYSALREVL